MLNWEVFFEDMREQRTEKVLLCQEEENKRRYSLRN